MLRTLLILIFLASPSFGKDPSFEGVLDSFETSGHVRCHSSHSIKMGGSRVAATGTESVRNAQLIYERAMNARSKDFEIAVKATEKLSAPPKEVIRHVRVPVAVPVYTEPYVRVVPYHYYGGRYYYYP